MSAAGVVRAQIDLGHDRCFASWTWSSLFEFCGRRAALAEAVAGELEPAGIMDDAVEDGVGDRRYADHLAPTIDRNLAGDNEGAGVVRCALGMLRVLCRAGPARRAVRALRFLRLTAQGKPA